ncbi:MAG: ethanolamine ammonia-lyase reactivating factor EutA [Treponema sp.]|jgi:ethanolamine utilization protein EutA|nr:ethanolamine ammonia-lyase reactivating factor EutA [Treponema sp.]
MEQKLISVGIDVGTSTTQVIFSRLSMSDKGGFFSVPKADIVSREIIYRGGIHETPLVSPETIDAEALTSLVNADFAKAGFAGGGVDTGAVIITGESARKENARAVLEHLSGLAGDFVVSTAGPDLEAVIAGRGSGAAEWSRKNNGRAVNLDIGGGTTNIAVFENGEDRAAGSLDVGGRVIRIAGGKIRSVSAAAAAVAAWKGMGIAVGDPADEKILGRVCGAMAEVLDMAMGFRKRESIFETLRTSGSAYFAIPAKPDGIFLSGGVADAVYTAHDDAFAYGDIGVLLGRALRQSALCTRSRLLRGGETIRATVVGAGSYTVNLSGSTIFYRGNVFPLKNLPVLRLSDAEERACYRGENGPLADRMVWFLSQHDTKLPALAFAGERNPGYGELNAAAGVFARTAAAVLGQGVPLVIVTEQDTAKALGQLISVRLEENRPLAVLDSIHAGDHTYIDVGMPLMGGIAAPVVIKTLIFG